MRILAILITLLIAFSIQAFEIDKKTIDSIKESADKGNAEAQFKMGILYEHGRGVPQSDSESVRWYSQAAIQGHAEAQCNLGGMYAIGKGIPQNYVEAMKWFMKAANQGQSLAQYRIGFMYSVGHGVPQDNVEALRWFKKASDQRQPYAQFAMGSMYELGTGGLPQDYSKAMEFYKKAANQGIAPAQYMIGKLYESGFGVPKNYSEAIIWYKKAADQGDVDAKNRIKYIYKNVDAVYREYIKPHIITTSNRALSDIFLKEYEERFLSKRLNSNLSDGKRTDNSLQFKNYINHNDIEWSKWEIALDLEYRHGSLFESNFQIGNSYLFLHIWDDGFNWAWDSYFYYLVPKEKRIEFLKDFQNIWRNENIYFYSAKLGYNYYESPFSGTGAYPINNIFRYLGKYYLIDDFLSFRDNNGIRNLIEIDEGGNTVNIAKFKIFTSIEELYHSINFPAYMSFLKTVNNIYGPGSLRHDGTLNTHDRKRNNGHYAAERAIIRPWIVSAEKKTGYYVYNDRLISFLEDWSFEGIWNQREYQTLLNHIPAAEFELAKFYQEKLNMEEELAQKLADSNIKHVIAAYFIVPSSYPGQSKENFEIGNQINNGLYSDSISQILAIDSVPYLNLILKRVEYSDLKNDFSKTLLMYAAHMNNFDTVKFLIEYGVDVNEITKLNDKYENSIQIEYPRNLNRNALTYAAENSSIEIIALLLDSGVDIELNGELFKQYLTKNPRFTDKEKEMPIRDLIKKYQYDKFFKPSFECYNASTNIEKAICQSKTLSIYDRELGNAYVRLLKESTFPEFDKKNQKLWLRMRDDECGKFVDQELDICLTQIIRSRTRYLHNRLEFH